MKYTVTGTAKNGNQVSITWEDGRLSGDYVTVKLAESLAEALEGEPVGPVCGPYTTTNHLADPLSAIFILREVIEVQSAAGDVPKPPINWF